MQHVLKYENLQNVVYDYIRLQYLLNIYFILLVIKKWWNKLFADTNEMNELWIRLSIRVNLVLKPYYEDYQSLLFYEELDKVKFSLSDQCLC